ncbi:CARS2 family protein [Megaselia abdita]
MKLDIIQRILKDYFQIDLITAMNITDIDDKIIKRSEEKGISWSEISRKYENEFWDDLDKLNIRKPDIRIRVTEHILKIVSFIEKLVNDGHAYVGTDQSVYFKVSSYPNYGKLQNIVLDNKIVPHKSSSADFALWKAKKQPNEPCWSSPWGEGRPGWHIECSSLASHLFGDTIDFHAGGLDLRFPHHENEDAQSCAFHCKPQWINNWLHIGQLLIKGETEKMSKSLKNTISIDEMLEKYSPDTFRMACVLSNYRNTMEYGDEMMETAKFTNSKFNAFKITCEDYLNGNARSNNQENVDPEQILKKFQENKDQIDECLRCDFDTAKVMTVLSELTKSTSSILKYNFKNQSSYQSSYVDVIGPIYKYTEKMFETFGFREKSSIVSQDDNLVNLVEDLLKLRMDLRAEAISTKNKQLFKVCDSLRDSLKKNGVNIKDYSDQSSWSFNKK